MTMDWQAALLLGALIALGCGSKSGLDERATREPPPVACNAPGDCPSRLCVQGLCVVPCAKNQGKAQLAASPGPTFIASAASEVFWSDPAAGVVSKISKAGGTSVNLANSQSPLGIAVDESYVYWAEEAAIRRVPITGGVAKNLASGINKAWQVAIDSTHVYWSNRLAKTAIMRVPKG